MHRFLNCPPEAHVLGGPKDPLPVCSGRNVSGSPYETAGPWRKLRETSMLGINCHGVLRLRLIFAPRRKNQSSLRMTARGYRKKVDCPKLICQKSTPPEAHTLPAAASLLNDRNQRVVSRARPCTDSAPEFALRPVLEPEMLRVGAMFPFALDRLPKLATSPATASPT